MALNVLTSVLARSRQREITDTQRRRQYDESGVAAGQGLPRAARSWKNKE